MKKRTIFRLPKEFYSEILNLKWKIFNFVLNQLEFSRQKWPNLESEIDPSWKTFIPILPSIRHIKQIRVANQKP